MSDTPIYDAMCSAIIAEHHGEPPVFQDIYGELAYWAAIARNREPELQVCQIRLRAELAYVETLRELAGVPPKRRKSRAA